MALSLPPNDMIYKELQHAVKECRERGLVQSTKWAAELLLAIPITEQHRTTFTIDHSVSEDTYQLALTYFELKEFLRVAHILTPLAEQSQKPSSQCTIPPAVCRKATFLRCYALYLAEEKSNEEDNWESEVDAKSGGNVRELQQIRKYLEVALNNFASKPDGFLLWLHGVILRELNLVEQARSQFLAAVHAFPCLWSAWVDLAALCTDVEMAAELQHTSGRLPQHWARHFFAAHVALELQQNTEGQRLYSELQRRFPGSVAIQSQLAVAAYNMREFDLAEKQFDRVRSADPHRLEGVDLYSNILYVKEHRAKLSALAHAVATTDRFRPESCVVLGNLFSLRGDHTKAVGYFQRALRLDRRCLAAWTLLGHEYMELRNTAAAVEAYRRAVNINPRDYRAWYGLGQTYELLKMPLFALHYFRKAAALRPYDARMWCAVAGCYEVLARVQDAIRCYERAEANKDRDGMAVTKLAALYHAQGDHEKAAYYYRRLLDLRDAEGAEGKDTVDALLYLATYCKGKGRWEEAEAYCSRLLDYAGKEKEEAKAILRELHYMRAKEARQAGSDAGA